MPLSSNNNTSITMKEIKSTHNIKRYIIFSILVIFSLNFYIPKIALAINNLPSDFFTYIYKQSGNENFIYFNSDFTTTYTLTYHTYSKLPTDLNFTYTPDYNQDIPITTNKLAPYCSVTSVPIDNAICPTSGYGLGTCFVWTCSSNRILSVNTYSNILVNNGSTRIISITPENNFTYATSTNFNFKITGYISNQDFSTSTLISLKYYQTNISKGGLTVMDAWDSAKGYTDINFYATSSGLFSYSTTTNLTLEKDIGKYTLLSYIQNPVISTGFWSNLFGSNISYTELDASSTNFIVSTSSLADKIADNLQADIDKYAIATSTLAKCSFIDGDLGSCLWGLIMPTNNDFKDMFNIILNGNNDSNSIWFRSGILNKFPLGYITSFISILSNTATTSIPVIDATLPSSLGLGTGQHIYLSLDSLSWIFNATSTYTYGDLTGKSLYEITRPYWEILVWLSFIFYIVSRILGIYILEQQVAQNIEYRKGRFNTLKDARTFRKNRDKIRK